MVSRRVAALRTCKCGSQGKSCLIAFEELDIAACRQVEWSKSWPTISDHLFVRLDRPEGCQVLYLHRKAGKHDCSEPVAVG